MNSTKKLINDLEDEDFDLDIGIENEIISSSIRNKIKLAGDSLFKKPANTVPLSSHENANDISILSSLIEEDSKTPINKPLHEDKDLLSQLFQDDEDEDADEQEFFRNESIIMSTQKTNNVNHLEAKKQEPEIIEISQPVKPNEKAIKDQSMNVSIKRRTISNEIPDGREMLNALKENKPWNRAQEELKDTFRSLTLNTQSIHEYNMQYYFKKFFEKDLIMRLDLSKNSARKLPFLCVWIKEIARKSNNATVILSDNSSDEISGTISNSILIEKWDCFMVGSVLILQDVCLMRVNYGKNCYHLNIKNENLLSIYHLNIEEITGANEVNKIDLIPIDCSKIKQLVEKFEELYSNFDYLTYVANTSMNKSKTTANDKSKPKKKTTSLSNLHPKPVPYQVPARPVQPPQPQQQSQTNKPQAPKPPPQPSRNFQFKSASNISTNSLNESQLNSSINLVSSTQSDISKRIPSMSQADISQLIFGIEDELFNDD